MSVLAPRTREALALTGLLSSIAMSACLPLGEPPIGRHLLATRDLEDVGFIEPAPGQRASIVTFRFAPVYAPETCASFWSLFAVDDGNAAAGGLATERLLADNAESDGPIDSYFARRSPAVRTDARGRLFVVWQPKTPAISMGDYFQCPRGSARIARIDPATGGRVELGSLYALGPIGGGLSSDRTRVAFTGAGAAGQSRIVLRDGDDREIAFEGTSPAFLGNDLYAIDADGALVKVDATGVPRTLVPDVRTFSLEKSARGPLLLLQTGADVTSGGAAVFDPATETATTLPSNVRSGGGSVSPSGRFVMQLDYSTYDTTHAVTYDLFDRDTGTTESHSLTGATNSYWRLGKDEFWIDVGEWNDKLTRWTPGQPIVTIDVGPGWGVFQDDERFWLRTSNDGSPTEARDPDDPGAPGTLLNPPGSTLSLMPRTLADGRLLVEANVASFGRHDIYVVDLVAGTSRPIASGGTVVAVGRTRVLALLNIGAANSGELSLIDLETGATTLIAENAYRYAVEPTQPGEDPLAPGLRVLALVRNRIASPYDGLWLSTLP